MARWKVVCGLMAIFLSGAVVGSAVSLRIVRSKIETLRTQTPEEAADRTLRRLSRRLDLTTEQAAAIRPTLVEFHRSLHRLRETARAEIDTLAAPAFTAIEGELTAGQREEFVRIKSRVTTLLTNRKD